jgi:hypothetical protein
LFGKAHDSAQFLIEGWGLPGGPFVWAIGERSQIALDVGDLPEYPDVYRLRLTVQPFTASAVPFQRVSIFVNDTLLTEDRLAAPTTLEMTMPRALLAAQQPAVITLVHQDAARPCDFDPGNADEGMISIGLHSLEILAGGVDE